MSHLLRYEGWSGTQAPGHVSYYVSPMSDAPARHTDARASVRRHAERVLVGEGAKHLRAAHAGPFDWSHLVDHRPDAPQGMERLDAQYWRANTYPSERYVLSVAGSTEHRLLPHDRNGYRNLYLAGDWTRNGMNCGAMESAVMGGLLCARAFDGFPRKIVGASE
ncbi:MAG: FAD-dependent oxidoreductase [Polyangiaceae bacterium]|nr:FAD-dependent oxidoreductase [Polyangiaceae bacterium]